MTVLNIHERELPATREEVGSLIDSLASQEDALWPCHSWISMKLDQSLGIGAKGGHGPVRYIVEEYIQGQYIKFSFRSPKGFHGFHSFEITRAIGQNVLLRHTLSMTTHGLAILSWPIVFRPMHDALLEDSLATAQASLGLHPTMQSWSAWVKFLRWVISKGKAHKQVTPKIIIQPKPDDIA
jgi:hypothetical protein